jgi:pimeloyl-ACP methyl ester carboxylesterase
MTAFQLSRFLPRALVGLVLVGALLFGVAFVLILSGDPTFGAPLDISMEALAASGIRFDQPYPSTVREFVLGDGTTLRAQFLESLGAGTTIIFLHGILGSSFPLNAASGLLREAAKAEIIALDLRGHGFSEGRPGDIDYPGQYEDDIAQVIAQVRAERPRQRVLLVGHSMGGGISLRYAQKVQEQRPYPVAGYLLFAPHLGWSSPTMPKTANAESDKFVRVHLPRILGLHFLNLCGVSGLNGLRTLFFNLPPELPLRSYSYRASQSNAPTDYREALDALSAAGAPLLVVVGSRDEAFIGDRYAEVIGKHGRVELVPGANHNGVLTDPRTVAVVTEWVTTLGAS